MTFREEIKRQSLIAHREMVRSKELLTSGEFCKRLGVNERRLAKMVATGSAFSIEVDGVDYFPALLADLSVDRKRLQSVCRMLVPAPPDCRLHYLSSRQGNLGAITPLEALADDKSYRHMRQMARAYAAEWSRTVVYVWAGHYKPYDLEPTYGATVGVDPRTGLWKRALEAMDAGGYIAPSGPYPCADAATVLVIRSEAGDLNHVEEARLSSLGQFMPASSRQCRPVGQSCIPDTSSRKTPAQRRLKRNGCVGAQPATPTMKSSFSPAAKSIKSYMYAERTPAAPQFV